jgi:transketolase
MMVSPLLVNEAMQRNIDILPQIANQLRILSIESTTAAGSGHPTSCCSAADLVAALFFAHMRFDPSNPHELENDRFILSKGHAAPLLYAAWEQAGHISKADVMSLRKLDSRFEGHPTPRIDFVDVATGSLGQGLAAGVGIAADALMRERDARTFVLMGDGECAEGSVWEAASLAGIRKLNHLVAIVDCNRLGQSQATAFGHNVETYQKRFEAFGWHSVSIDGHDMNAILRALEKSKRSSLPFAIIAETIKGKGIAIAADKLGWHGKALSAEQAKEAIADLRLHALEADPAQIIRPEQMPQRKKETHFENLKQPDYYPANKKVATRKAFGHALARVAKLEPRIVALDGDVENSTFSEEFGKDFPDRFMECFIAEQTMVGVASGFSAMGRTPFVSTFAAFFSRAADQIRMAAISQSNLKLCGSHCGVSIGEDGPSQMGLEDLAMMRAVHGSVVFYPSDAMSTERLVEIMARENGIFYMRTSRPETPILYSTEEEFKIGGAKILRQSEGDLFTIVAAGVTLFEALKAADDLKQKEGISVCVIDAYSVKPLAKRLILSAAKKTDLQVITVEDHYIEGGLGDAVAGELSQEGVRVHKMAVHALPHSGKEEELLEKYQINSAAIQSKVKELLHGSGRIALAV